MLSEVNSQSSGDSFTDVGYSPAISPQPNPDNYEGNPPPPGTSSCYTSNYQQILSSELNQTFVSLYNLAHSGAVVDGDLVDPYETEDNTFVHQVSDKFLPSFSGGSLPRGNGTRSATISRGGQAGKRGWNGKETLVTSWFGINDVDRAMGGYWPLDPIWESKAPMMIESLFSGLEKVSTPFTHTDSQSIHYPHKSMYLFHTHTNLDSGPRTRRGELCHSESSTILAFPFRPGVPERDVHRASEEQDPVMEQGADEAIQDLDRCSSRQCQDRRYVQLVA